jgi:3-isopropylmalate dehydrogenase
MKGLRKGFHQLRCFVNLIFPLKGEVSNHKGILMNKKICLLSGDGIGPEITHEAVQTLDAVAKRFGHAFSYQDALIGGAAIDAGDHPLPAESVAVCKASDAVFLGAVGVPKWDQLENTKRPEAGLLGIRKELGLFANLRPAILFPELAGACLLRPDIVRAGLDILVVRELTGCVYFGQPRGIETRDGERVGFNTMLYREHEIRRIARLAFETARLRRKRVCSCDKANVLDVSRLWRDVVNEVHQDFQDVELTHIYVDNAAMQLVRNPAHFDVLVTGNLFGDILTDEAAVITGSLGMLPSASLGASAPGLFEPIHGSAPDIAGQDKANPLAAVLSVAMMLRLAFGLEEEAVAVENAARACLKDGYRTGDIMETGKTLVGTRKMGELVRERLAQEANRL